MTTSVFVEPGEQIALDRPSLSAPAPHTTQRLLDHCELWASEVGVVLTGSPDEATTVIAGPGVSAPPDALRVLPGQGIDGFRWAIRSVAFSARWPVEVVPYGPLPDHVADVRRPTGQSRGVVVLLHGGFWMDAWRRNLMDGLAVDLVARGFETWNAEYRRVGSGGGWPQTWHDVRSVIDVTAAHTGSLRMTVVGHSAGGHLALEAARRSGDVDCVVSLAGLCDLEAARRQRVGGNAVDRFVGAASVADASPVAHVPLETRVVLAHCAGDSVVPFDQSRRYADAARRNGAEVQLLTLEHGDHMSLIEPERGWGEVAGALFG